MAHPMSGVGGGARSLPRQEQSSEVFVVCAQIEQEIAELDDDEKKMFLEELGLSASRP